MLVKTSHLLVAIGVCCFFITTAKSLDAQQTGFTAAEKRTYFFPVGVLPNGVADILVRHLEFMNEPSLLPGLADKNIHAYRVAKFGSSDTQTVVRLSINQSGTANLVAKITSKGIFLKNARIEVASTDVSEFLKMLQAVDYWEAPGTARTPRVIDADAFTLEGVRSGEYRVIYRRNPGGSDFAGLIAYLEHLSNSGKH